MVPSREERTPVGTPCTTPTRGIAGKFIDMSWKNISKISRGPNESTKSETSDETPVPPKKDRSAEAQFVFQSMMGLQPMEEPKSDLQKRLDLMSEEDKREDEDREGLIANLKLQYLNGTPFDQLIQESGVSRSTLFRWRKEGNWDYEKNKAIILAKKLQETLQFYEDPSNTEKALAQHNLQLLLKIQGINLAKLAHSAMSGGAPDVIAVAISDSLNKYSSMLEKLIKSEQSLKSDGVEKKQVVHVHQIDMDEAVQLALEMKRKGHTISVQDAIGLLQAQQSVKKDKQDGEQA